MQMNFSSPYFTLDPKQQGVPGWHDGIEIIFVLRGTGLLSMDNIQYRINEEDIAVINIGQGHSLERDSGSAILSFNIPASYLALYAPEAAKLRWDCRSFLYPRSEQEAFDKIRKCLAALFILKDQEDRELKFRGELLYLLSLMTELFPVKEREVSGKGKAQMYGILEYVVQHFQEKLSLSDLASQAHFTPSYLSRLFQKELGMTYTQYLTQLRLNRACSLLKNTEKSVTVIAYDTGFRNTYALIEGFKKAYGMTPGAYRQREKQRELKIDSSTETSGQELFYTLLKYQEDEAQDKIPVQQVDVLADCREKGLPLNHTWRRLINISYALDLLSAQVQEQLTRVQREIGFSMARCLGFFNDNMMVFHKNVRGEVSFYFDYIDRVLDFLLSVDLLPYIVLSYMPEEMARGQRKAYFCPSYISMPEDPALWERMIREFMDHLLDRYGKSQVRKWLFQPWAHPEVGFIIKTYTEDEYLAFYRETVKIIKRADPEIRIAGPDTRITSWEFNRKFLRFAKENGCVPDIYSLQCFHFENEEDIDREMDFVMRDDTLNLPLSGDPSYLASQRIKFQGFLQEEGLDSLPVMLSTWNSTSWQRDLTNDTCSQSAFLYKDIWQTYDQWEYLGYWFFFDYVTMDEVPPADYLFYGGFGLLTQNGMAKSGYQALQLLAKAYDRLIYREEGIAVTKGGEGYRIYLYNCCEYTKEYRYQHTDGISLCRRYEVFGPKGDMVFHIRLTGAGEGSCKLRHYIIGPETGSIYDEWVKIGAPRRLTKEEQQILEAKSLPGYQVEELPYKDDISFAVTVRPHEIRMVDLAVE